MHPTDAFNELIRHIGDATSLTAIIAVLMSELPVLVTFLASLASLIWFCSENI